MNNISPTSMSLQTTQQRTADSGNSTTLSTEQRNLIETTLSEFDASNLSAADASEIVSLFSEAGIQPGQELESALSNAGFDAREIGSLAAPQNSSQEGMPPPPPPPPQNSTESGINQSNLELLQSILEKYQDLSNLNNQDQVQLSQELQDAGLLEPGALINTQS